MTERTRATFAQYRAGAADVGAVTSATALYYVVCVMPDNVYTAPLGTPTRSGEPSSEWVLMTDVSGDGKRRICRLCNVPLATGRCEHADVRGDQVVLSRHAWLKLTGEGR